MRLCVKLLSVTALIITGSSVGVCQSSKKILDELFTTMSSRDQFNGTVLVAENGEMIFSGAYGYANIDKKETLTTNSVFELGYLTKQFTAMAIMMLKEKDKLGFDDKIAKFFPEIPYTDVTIRQLLTHTSGIPCYYRDIHKWPNALAESKKLITNADILNLIYQSKPTANFAAGTRWGISNTNYCLLALIIEQASGETYAQYMQSAIFDKLNMNNTYCHSKADNIKIDGLAIGYEYSTKKGTYVNAVDLYSAKGFKGNNAILGSHGIKSSVEDLFKWDKALSQNKLVSKTTLEEGYTSATLVNGRATDYGFGWEINQRGEGNEVTQDGAIDGYLSYISKDLNTNRTIIYLRNKAAFGGRGLKRSIEKALNNNQLSVPKASLTEYIKLKVNEVEGEKLVEDYMDFSYNQKDNWYYSQIEFVILVRDFLDANLQDKAATIVKIIEAEQPTSETYTKLGEVYERMGFYTDATAYYKKAVSADSQNTEAAQRLKNLTE